MSWREAMLPDFTPSRQPHRNWICDKVYGMIATRVTVGHVVGIVLGTLIGVVASLVTWWSVR